jgi:arabinogalactan oligomer/maltooligosaccharide transport system substrate-binding protein
MVVMMLGVSGFTGARAQDATLSGELTLWHGWTGAEADALNNDVLPAWQAANPDVTINALAVPFDQLKNKYQTEAATGGGPDLLIGPLDWIGELSTAELIKPLDDLVDQATLDQYVPASVEALRYDGSLYGMPESIETVALYYNKTMVETAPATTAELTELAATYAGTDNYAFALFSNFYHPAGYLFGFGAQLFDEENNSAIDSPETVEFLNWMKSFQDTPGLFAQNDDGAISSLFKEGRAAMVINGPWALGDYQAALGADNVGVAPLPKISEKGDASPMPFLGVKHIMMNSNIEGDQATLAAEFMKWFTGPESVAMLAEKAGHLPAHTGVDISANPIAAAFVEQAASATPMPTIPEMGQVWTPAGDMITKVLSGDATAEEAAAEAQEQINNAIEQMRNN